MSKLTDKNVFVWHANFELIPTISFFKKHTWKKWSHNKDLSFAESNYSRKFGNAQLVYDQLGLGFMPNNFLTRRQTHATINTIIKSLEEIGLKN